MPDFECSVKDLMANTESINADLEIDKSEENVSPDTEKPPDLNLTVYQRLYTDKNIKMVLFIALVYLVLNSEQIYTILSNNTPMLIPEGSPGFLGKAAIGLVLGIIIVVFTSFFSF